MKGIGKIQMGDGKIYIPPLKEEEIGKWGKGIPHYKSSDVLNKQEILDFVVHSVKDVLEQDGYRIIDWFNQVGFFPNYIVEEKNNHNKKAYIIIFASVYPQKINIQDVDINLRKKFVEVAHKHNAICLFASVGIGAVDHERFEAGLCLRGDGFYLNFTGLESVEDSIYDN